MQPRLLLSKADVVSRGVLVRVAGEERGFFAQ